MEPTMCASVDQSPYLVESQGALVVLRLRQCFSSTTKFRAFNVPLEEGFHGSDLLQENSILFLGCHNASFSIRCSNKNFQCVGNSICFTVDFCECLALTRKTWTPVLLIIIWKTGKSCPAWVNASM
ncbi:unnamed protein product [Prunus armeniaca]|uniref:KIB1-4 beta-propeller domain-containing protein n=1 Tax=Prunus armeniaca TaxID=36596 RepID=A0A6J5XSW4_PRUAR|nr:unnamed protein product [Prunus armeniaca]